jgi:hypothetical protein
MGYEHERAAAYDRLLLTGPPERLERPATWMAERGIETRMVEPGSRAADSN